MVNMLRRHLTVGHFVELVGSAAEHRGVQPQREVAGHDAACLEVAGAALGHLHVVDTGELGVELAGGIGGPGHSGPAQGRSGLGHRLALAVGLAGLAGPGGQAQVGLEVVASSEPAGFAHDGAHGRAADRPPD